MTITLGEAGLEPIDLVLMSADRFGDGSSELERVLADGWRAANAIGDEIATLFMEPKDGPGDGVVVVDLASSVSGIPRARLQAQLRALRRMIGGSRGLNAQDYRLAQDADKVDARNPKGLALDGSGDLAGLPARIGAARGSLGTLMTTLGGRLETLEPAYAAARTDAATFDPTAWDLPLDGVRSDLRRLVLHGFGEAIPRSATGTGLDAALGLYEQGRSVLAAVARRIEAADLALEPLPIEPALTDPTAEDRRIAERLDRRLENLLTAARHALGSNFPLQPGFAVEAGAIAELDASLANPVEVDSLAIEGWLQSLARVRPRIGDAAFCLATASWTTGREELRLLPVQIPRRPNDSWIAQEWSEAPADGEILSVVAIGPPASLAGTQEGLLVDEWTETVPGLDETSGLAFHFDRPNAAAPQALLLVTPSQADGRWRKDELPSVILDTFARARLRALEPDHVTASSLFPILPMTLSRFSRHEPFAAGLLVRDVAEFNFPVE